MFYYANKNQWYNGRIIPSHDTNSSSTLSMNNTSQLSPFFIYKNYYRRVVIIQWLMAIPPLWIVFSKASYSHVFLWYQSFGSCYRFYPNPIFFLFVICLKFVFCFTQILFLTQLVAEGCKNHNESGMSCVP